MNAPLFSIITVTLNPGQSLDRTVESIKAQSFRAFEHIVKDGGSTDGSVDRYVQPDGDYRPRIVRQPDKGIYDAMNQGLGCAAGRYVLFLNAGDALYGPETLATVAQAAKDSPNLALIYGDYATDRLGCIVTSPRRLTPFFLYRTMLCHQVCFESRELVAALGGFDTSLRVFADYDLLLRIVLGRQAAYRHCGEPVSRYMGDGFSTRPEAIRRARAEVRRLRHRHFSLAHRVLLAVLLAASLPKLRMALMRCEGLRPLRRFYQALANGWNSLGS